MKSAILSFIILMPCLVLFVELTEFEMDFRSYLLGITVAGAYSLLNHILENELKK